MGRHSGTTNYIDKELVRLEKERRAFPGLIWLGEWAFTQAWVHLSGLSTHGPVNIWEAPFHLEYRGIILGMDKALKRRDMILIYHTGE